MTWYIEIYARKMGEETVSATLGMSATVGEMSTTVGDNVCNSGGMSATVGEMSTIVGKLNMVWEI